MLMPMLRALTCLATMLLVSSTPAVATGQEMAKLSIGVVLPLSGPQAAFGKEAMRGIDLALDVLRLTDPELAGRITILPGDDLSTAKDALAAAEKLIEKDRAHVLIGSVTSATTAAVATAARRALVPLVAPISTQTTLTLGGPVFRSCFDELLQGAILADFALNVLGVREAATLRDDTLAAQGFVDRFAEAFTAGGGKVVAQETYDIASDDFTVPLKKIEAAGAKVIITPASYQTAGAVIQQARKLNVAAKFLGGDSWDTKLLNQMAGNAAAGHFHVAHFAADDTDPGTREFVKAFQLKYGRPPGALAALTYDAMGVVLDAFKRANSNAKGSLTAAFGRTKDFAGVTGSVTFSESGEYLKAGIVKETTADASRFKARVVPKPRTGTGVLPSAVTAKPVVAPVPPQTANLLPPGTPAAATPPPAAKAP